jgi:hypothetical protein
MSSVGSITSTLQAAQTATTIRRVNAASSAAPARDADGDGDRSPPGADSIWGPGKGGVIDTYA